MTELGEQLVESLQDPFPAPRRFGWLRIWRRDSGRSLGLAVIVAIISAVMLLAGRLHWSSSSTAVPSVEIASVSLSAAERQAHPDLQESPSSSPIAREAMPSDDSLPVERVTPVEAAPKAGSLSREPTAEAARAISDQATVTDEAIQRLKRANERLQNSLVGPTGVVVKLGDGKSAEFFGLKAPGRRFVYVIDRSSSMASYDQRFPKANEQLLRSVLQLRSRQQFFVVYFNTGPHPMFSPAVASASIKADRKTKKQLIAWVQTVFPGGGTDPASSLQMALKLEPDAIFMLTDGEFGSHVLDLLRRENPAGEGQVSINTIAIVSHAGEGQLKQIAKENKGRFRFVP